MQTLQDFFAKTMDVALITVRDNNWLTDASNNKDFCYKYTRCNQIIFQRCDECHQNLEKIVKNTGKPVITDCHIGITLFAVPLTIESKYVACIIGGQVLREQPDKNHFRKIARELKIKEEVYLNELSKLAILPNEKLKSITELLYFTANSIATNAYANHQLSKLGLNYKIPKNKEMEEWLYLNYGRAQRVITAREYQVLKLLVSGKSNTEIAKELFISVHTAKAHVSSILEKLQVTDRVQLAVKAVREGLIK